jgi:hypothetical protein
MEPILRPQRRQALFRWCFSCAMLSSSMARISTQEKALEPPSCVSPPLQLKREWSAWPEFGSDRGNPRELSKG